MRAKLNFINYPTGSVKTMLEQYNEQLKVVSTSKENSNWRLFVISAFSKN